MARFFINYPELINKNIIGEDAEMQTENEIGANKKSRLVNNW
jgi:hypothetical protein